MSDITTGLVHYYKFNEANGLTAVDSVVGGLDATLAGNFTGNEWVPSGKIDGALSFVQNNWCLVANSSTFCPPNLSVSLWVWINDFQSQAWIPFVGKWYHVASEEKSWLLHLPWDNPAGSYRPSFRLSGGGNDDNPAYGTTQLQVGQWYHIVGTYDGINIRIYLDTVNEGTQPYAGGIHVNTRTLYFGRYDDNSLWLNGKLDDVRIYNRLLTPDDITALYNYVDEPEPEPEPEPIPVVTSSSVIYSDKYARDRLPAFKGYINKQKRRSPYDRKRSDLPTYDRKLLGK